jgi:glycosidase
MNYPVRKGIIDYLTGKGKESLAYALTEVTSNAPDQILHNQMNLLGTHDTVRILTILGGESSEGKSNATLAVLRMDNGRRSYAVKKLMSAYTVLATLPGIPTIFYGDEAGLEGYHDPFNRMPYPWGREEKTLLEHYKTIGEIRRKNSVYKKGEFKLVLLDEELLVFSRKGKGYDFLTVLNNGERDLSLSFSQNARELLGKKTSNKFMIQSNTALIFKVKSNSEIEIG